MKIEELKPEKENGNYYFRTAKNPYVYRVDSVPEQEKNDSDCNELLQKVGERIRSGQRTMITKYAQAGIGMEAVNKRIQMNELALHSLHTNKSQLSVESEQSEKEDSPEMFRNMHEENRTKDQERIVLV